MEYILEKVVMAVLNNLKRWISHKVSSLIKTNFYNQTIVTREKFLGKLEVLHESEHYLVVNKHHDLVFNTDPPDTR